ncbi:MAG: cell division protein FtsL, partial [Rubrivivax sp.]|nr:cell division protein FtsL [Rubrivivax sp.]
MNKLNLILLVALLASSLWLVQSTHDARRVFSALDRAKKDEQQLAAEYKRLDAERQVQATHRQVQQVAKDKLRMRSATPDVMAYVVDPGAS